MVFLIILAVCVIALVVTFIEGVIRERKAKR